MRWFSVCSGLSCNRQHSLFDLDLPIHIRYYYLIILLVRCPHVTGSTRDVFMCQIQIKQPLSNLRTSKHINNRDR